MTTAWTNTEIQATYGDGLQLGNSGSGVLTTVQNVRDGLGTATALWLSTDAVKAVGATGFLIPYQAGMAGVPGGYRGLASDGVTAIPLIAVVSSSSMAIAPTGATGGITFITIGIAATGSQPSLLLTAGGTLQAESFDFSQDGRLIGLDNTSANKVVIGDDAGGASQQGDMYFVKGTGKGFHFTIATVEVMAIGSGGEVSLGITAPATNANTGFPYMPKMAGTPSGTPTAKAGFAPFVFDSTAGKFWVHNGTTWKFATLT